MTNGHLSKVCIDIFYGSRGHRANPSEGILLIMNLWKQHQVGTKWDLSNSLPACKVRYTYTQHLRHDRTLGRNDVSGTNSLEQEYADFVEWILKLFSKGFYTGGPVFK